MRTPKQFTTHDVSVVDDNSLTGYATVEVVDLENDIIRVDGIDLSAHTNDNPIKIFADHSYSREDGHPAIIGKVETLEKTYYKDGITPALKFTMSFARDSNGVLTDAAKAWRELYKSGYADSFSIGMERVDGKKRGEEGVDWLKTKLLEISAAALPANNFANVCKIMNKYNIKYKGSNMATDNVEKAIGSLNPLGVEGTGFTYGKEDVVPASPKFVEGQKDMDMGQMCMDHTSKCFEDFKGHMEKCMDTHHKSLIKAMNERMDDLESSVSVAQDGPSPVYNSQKALKDINAKKLKEEEAVNVELLLKAVKELKNEINKD